MTSKKKFLEIISIFVLSVLFVVFVPSDIFEADDPTPGKLEGIWYHSDLDCMDGPSILIFENGKCFNYSPPHKEIYSMGNYKKLSDGKYELTKVRIIKPDSPALINREYRKRLSNRSLQYTQKTILAPCRNYMPYEVVVEVKLRRVTDVPKFQKLYQEFKQLLKEKGVNAEE